MKALELLEGRKTYIVSAVAAIGAFAYTMDWITQDQLITLNAFLAPFGLAFLRSGVDKAGFPK